MPDRHFGAAAVASIAGVGNIATNWSVVGTGDFNGDGKTDIVWRDTAGDTSIWLMNGATVLSAGGLGNVPATRSVALVGDYDGDGMSDLLWRDTNGNTSMWFMNGAAVSSTAGVGNIPRELDRAIGQRRVKPGIVAMTGSGQTETCSRQARAAALLPIADLAR